MQRKKDSKLVKIFILKKFLSVLMGHYSHIMEMDVHLTKDKQVVVHHDESLERLTGMKRNVPEVYFEDIPK